MPHRLAVLTVALALFALAPSALADVPDVAVIYPSQRSQRSRPVTGPPARRRAEGRGIRAGGIALLAAGGANVLLGLFASVHFGYVIGPSEIDDNGEPLGKDHILAIALIGSGGGMMLGAIPLWLVGQRRLNKAERRTTSDRQQTTQPTVAIGPGGAALRWSF